MKIYTKTGDSGTTSLFSGGRVSKTHLRVEAYGTVDELNSHLGMVRALDASDGTRTRLESVQNQLFRLGSDLATPLSARADWLVRIGQEEIDWLESDIDAMTDELPQLKQFILPGGTPAAAQIHIARTVCRRAERRAVALAETDDIGEYVVVYLNRLSDWLFTLARWENLQAGADEITWSADS